MSKFHRNRVHPGTGSSGGQQPRVKPLAFYVAVALSQMVATGAMADSGSGVDTIFANALNPAGLSSARAKDPDGLGEASHSRSPTGFLYPYPWLVSAPNKTDSGWLSNASAEFGGLASRGEKESAKFREYKDLRGGFYLNNVSLQAEKPADAFFVDAYGGGLGRDDQYFSLSTGRYNDWKVKVFYNETPHVFTSTYRNLWNGTGTGNLTLKPPLTAGPQAPATAATVNAEVRNAVAATPNSTLSLIREKGGIRLDLTLPSDWKFYASYTNEHREGARPFGMVFGGGGSNSSAEIPESIDYNTHDFLTGVQWGNARTNVNLQVSASLFRNNIDIETIANPWFLPTSLTGLNATSVPAVKAGQFDLYPDNDAYTVKAEVAHTIPEFARARLTGVFLATSTRQNDALIPASPNGDVTINNSAVAGLWNTTASLSKPNAGARIDSKLIDLGLAFNPLNGLDIKGKWRHYETANSTEYWSCNPLTGQWGRLINNASAGNTAVFASPSVAAGVNDPAKLTALANTYDGHSCDAKGIAAIQALNLIPTNGNSTIRNTPYEFRQDNLSLGGDFRFTPTQSVNVSYERENFHRDHRERDKTWEDKFKIGYVNRDLAGGTLRASVEDAKRRGSTYNSDPYEEFYSASLGPKPTAENIFSASQITNVTPFNVSSWIHTNDLHRKFDLADRDLSVLNLRFNRPLTDEIDLGLSLQLKDNNYPSSQFGRNGHWRQNSFNADLNWQPSPELNVYGYLTQQNGHITQSGDNAGACQIGVTYYFRSDGSIGSDLPAANGANNVGLGSTLTAAQIAAGVTTLNNGVGVTIDAGNWEQKCGQGTAPLNPLYATSRTWSVSQDDSNTTAGIGAKWDLGKVKVDLNYAYSYGRTHFTTSYASAYGLNILTNGNLATTAQKYVKGLIDAGFSDQVIQTDVVDAGLLVPLGKATTIRLTLRYEAGKYSDPHYDGVASNPVPVNNYVFLDSGPQTYHVTTVGAFLQWNW